MPYVYSTLTNSTSYAIYKPTDPKQVGVIEKKILIKGGSNLATKTLITPLGVATKVSDEELELLEKDFHFKQHVKNGFITVDKRVLTPEKAVEHLNKRDLSAPKTPNDPEFKGKPPKTEIEH